MEIVLSLLLILLVYCTWQLFSWWSVVILFSMGLSILINRYKRKKICPPVLFAVSFLSLTLAIYAFIGGTIYYDKCEDERREKERLERELERKNRAEEKQNVNMDMVDKSITLYIHRNSLIV